MSWTSRSIRAEPAVPEDGDLVVRQIVLGEQPVAHGVVDVVVDVRDPIDEAHDLPLERLRLALARVREDPVADLVGEVERARDPERLLVVPEAPAEALADARRRARPPRVPEGRVPHVVPEADRLGEVLVQAQRPGDHARDRRRLERVRHARAVVVAIGVDEDLRLPLQPPERLRVDDAVAVALELGAHAARLLGSSRPASRASGRRTATATRSRARIASSKRHRVSVEGRGAGSRADEQAANASPTAE